MKYKSLIPRTILACALALMQLPSLLAVRIVLNVSKNQASTIVQHADGAYEMVADPLQTLKIFLSYAWIWGVIALCFAAAIAIPIVLGLRRGAPSIPVIALGGTAFAGQTVLAALLALVLPGIYEFELSAFMFVRYDLSVLYKALPDDLRLYAGKLLLIALGASAGVCALLALSLAVTELVLWLTRKAREN
ncbi:MAG: hypothetical protein J6S28_05580 [Clostridia bacterium]|nr:hypothetical protein [Clostridia bacterium]